MGTVNKLLMLIIASLIIYSVIITYQHVQGQMIEKRTKDIIEKQLRDSDIDPNEYNFDKGTRL